MQHYWNRLESHNASDERNEGHHLHILGIKWKEIVRKATLLTHTAGLEDAATAFIASQRPVAATKEGAYFSMPNSCSVRSV